MSPSSIEIRKFDHTHSDFSHHIREFVSFHWRHYRHEPRFIPLLNIEFLGLKIVGMRGFFEPSYSLFQHGKVCFLTAYRDREVVGRTMVFTNDHHNQHWHDHVGFFGFFECIEDQEVANKLLSTAGQWLREQGMDTLRGPQNLPINEATPGILIDGFDAIPMVYYHYNHPYYQKLLVENGMQLAKRVMGFKVPVQTPIAAELKEVTARLRQRYNIRIEPFTRRNIKEFREYMFEIYNEAWDNNWGFVPFTRNELFRNIEDMMLIWDPAMFLFAFVDEQPAAFFGSVPNIFERMKPNYAFRRLDIIRAVKMLLTKHRIKTFRQGYFGIKPKYRRIGLDAILLYEAKAYTQQQGYESCDIGWVLEDNTAILKATDFMGGHLSREYGIYQKIL